MKRLLILLYVYLLFVSCTGDAPRDNPYDLLNPEAGGYITGRVSCFSGKGLENVYVVIDSTFTVLTNGDGYYFYGPLRPDSVFVEVLKSGYVSMNSWTVVRPGLVDTLNFIMNAIPQFFYKKVYSRSSNWYSVGWLYEVIIEAIVVDSDYIFDVESVRVSTGDTMIKLKYFEPVDDSGYAALFRGKIQGNDVVDMSGESFLLNAYDTRGSWSSTVSILYDFIDTFTIPTFPVEGSEVNVPFNFVWRKYPGYYYHLLVWRRESDMDEPVIDIDSIPTMDTVYHVGSLSPGYYEWAVFIVDNKSNMGGKVSYFLIP
ncbi:carboxypeptidase regulatory-like domain-containing protein [candidate division WOR-3 bacterium]|nr:carboxypeptidase regulatory-like domain-containing protein [candidate division WOR-3 bacterium]